MARAQWPTWAVVLSIYGLFLALTLFWTWVPIPLLFVLGGLVTAWYSALEHEVIHGHPTRWPWVNRLIVAPPLLVWLPFGVYALTHRAHHRDEILTDPFDDPESYYLAQDRWAILPPWVQRLCVWQNTLLGRLTLGVGFSVALFVKVEAAHLWRGQPGRRAIWAGHGVLVLALFAYLTLVCALPIWLYLCCFVLPGTSLILLRSYLEHQWAEAPKHRTAIVEAGWFWRLLFLNNNFHLVHHERPAMPWYELPGEYRANKAAYVARNGAYVVRGYGAIARAYAFRAKEPVRHPRS